MARDCTLYAACATGMTVPLSSPNVKPRPALTFVLYLKVAHRTTGRSAPPVGRGAMAANFAARLTRRVFFLPAWFKWTLTRSIHFFLQCTLAITLFPLRGILRFYVRLQAKVPM